MTKIALNYQAVKNLASARGIANALQLSQAAGLSYGLCHEIWNEGLPADFKISTVEKLANVLAVSPLSLLVEIKDNGGVRKSGAGK